MCRQFTTLWFNSSNKSEEWYIGKPKQIASFDTAVKKVIVTKEIRGLLRSVNGKEHWKGNEFQIWTLHSLLGCSISTSVLEKADQALKLECLNLFYLKVTINF